MSDSTFRAALPYVLLLALGACDSNLSSDELTGGIEGSGRQTPAATTSRVTSSGAVEAKGSVFVNGVKYDLVGAAITIDALPAADSDIAVGDIVIVEGDLDASGNTGTARRVTIERALAGPIASTDVFPRRFTVLGQAVQIDAGTIVENGVADEPLHGLVVRDDVEVSGFFDSSGLLYARRIAQRKPTTPLLITGRVHRLDTANHLFAINGQVVDYATATLTGFAGQPFAEAPVRVTGDTVTADGRLVANNVALREVRLPGMSGDLVQVYGRVTRFSSRSDFDVDGHRVVTNARTSGELQGLDSFVFIKGTLLADGVVLATEIVSSASALLYGTDSGIFVTTDEDDGNFAFLARGSRPEWSPDGRRIAFGDYGKIHLIDPDGTDDVVIGSGASPSWSPDGSQLAFSSIDGISVMRADGTPVRTLVRHDFRTDIPAPWNMGVDQPSWSPDGSHIAFLHRGDGDTIGSGVYVMRSDGSELRSLSTGYSSWDPSWSPDSSRVFFWSYSYGFVEVTLSGEIKRQPMGAEVNGAKPVWSRDGQAVAFASRLNGYTSSSIYRHDFASRTTRLLIPNAEEPAWGPNGRLVFRSSLRCRGGTQLALFRDGQNDGFYYELRPARAFSVRPKSAVQWLNMSHVGARTARIVSVSAPLGGAPFDSGALEYGDVFHFVPNVSGAWEYMDLESGMRGTLTAGPGAPVPTCG